MQTFVGLLILNWTAKSKLAILKFFYFVKIVKNSIVSEGRRFFQKAIWHYSNRDFD